MIACNFIYLHTIQIIWLFFVIIWFCYKVAAHNCTFITYTHVTSQKYFKFWRLIGTMKIMISHRLFRKRLRNFQKRFFHVLDAESRKIVLKTLWKDTQVEDRQINGDYFYTNCFNQMSKKMDLLIVNLVTLEQTFIDYYNFDSLLRLEYNKL